MKTIETNEDLDHGKQLERIIFDKSEINEYQKDIFLEKILLMYAKEFKKLSKAQKDTLFFGIKLVKESLGLNFVKTLFLGTPLNEGQDLYLETKKVPLSSIIAIIQEIKATELEHINDLYSFNKATLKGLKIIESVANINNMKEDFNYI